MSLGERPHATDLARAAVAEEAGKPWIAALANLQTMLLMGCALKRPSRGAAETAIAWKRDKSATARSPQDQALLDNSCGSGSPAHQIHYLEKASITRALSKLSLAQAHIMFASMCGDKSGTI